MSNNYSSNGLTVSKGVSDLFDNPIEVSEHKQAHVVSKGTLPFPKTTPKHKKPFKGTSYKKPVQPRVAEAVEQPVNLFPTTRNTGIVIDIKDAILTINAAVTQKARENSMIGFETQSAWENSDDENNVPVEYQVLKEKAHKRLLFGDTRKGFIVKPDGTTFDHPAQLNKMILDFKVVAPVKRMANQRKLYLFKLPEGYKAYTDTVRIEDMLNKDMQSFIRVSYIQHHDNDGRPVGPRRQLLYTPIGSCPLHETDLVSFVYHDETGLELWQPGQYIGSMNHKEKESWVHLDLLEH